MTSIRQRLTRQLMLVLAFIMGAGLIAIYAVTREVLVDSFDAMLRAKAITVSAMIELDAGRIHTDFSADFLHGFSADHPRYYFEIWDSTNNVLIRSPSLQNENLPLRTDGTAAHPKSWNLPLPNGRSGRAVAFNYAPDPDVSTPASNSPPLFVRLVVAEDRGELDRNLNGLLGAVIAGGLLFMGAVLWAVPRVLRQGLAQLNHLADQATQIDAATLASRFPTKDLPAELQPIAERLNDLLARLEFSFERERRYNADLAHELRTPISELRSLVECALKWPESRDPASDTHLLEIAVQMEALVSRMLMLARSERGELAATMSTVDLQSLTNNVWRAFADRAEARQLRPIFSLALANVSADQALLKSILSNLFDNAVSYAPVGSELHITGLANGNSYTLQVANPAGELESGDLANLFDRFWRKEASRTGGEHFGFGLCLARAFASAMGWQLTAHLDSKNWLVFRLLINSDTHRGIEAKPATATNGCSVSVKY